MSALDPLNQDILRALTEAVGAVPGVHDVAAVARKGVRVAAQPSRGRMEQAAPPVVGHASAEADLLAADLFGGDVHLPGDAPRTLQKGLRRAAEQAPGKGTVYITEGNDDVLQTYAELLDEAQHVLGGLRAAGLRPGDAALFVFGSNRGYLTAFWACVLGGFVPTPVAVATTYTAENEANRKLRGAWQLLDRPVLVTDAATEPDLVRVRALWDEPDVRVLIVEELARHEADTAWFPATPDSPVLNLLTSGSTGVPKCVQHTNSSVVSRTYAVIQHCGLTADDISLIWMPFDHVTVVYYNVRDVFLQCLHVNAKIDHFLSDPLLWLDWADRYRVTNTWAPNFAMALVSERAAEIAERSWDLSRLRDVVNAGEPVIAATSRRFLELLAPHGMAADAMVPCWGMSETCSGVTYTRQSREDHTAGTVAIDPASLGGTIRHLDPADQDAIVLTRVGRPIPGVRLRVVDDAGRVLPEGRMGELRITGPTIMAGYFRNEEANREGYDEQGWFRTGDLAFVHDGEVVIAGRKKDQIIVRGTNYMAHELESVVERVDGVRVTFSAAVGVREPGASTDQLVVFYVPKSWDAAALARTSEQVRAVLVRESGIAPDVIVPVTKAEFPKTANGKIQRPSLVARFKAGGFADRVSAADEPQDGTWIFGRQWTRLAEPATGAADPYPAVTPGVCLVLAADDDAERLGINVTAVTVRRGEEFTERTPYRFRVPATDRVALRRLLSTVTTLHGGLASVVFALPLSLTGEPDERLATATAELAALVAALADGEFGRPQLLVVTRGAVHVHDGDRVDLGVCALTGLVRTAVSEAAPLPVRLLDLPADTADWASALRAELADPGRTGIVAARGGERWQPKLAPVAPEGAAATGGPVHPGGIYLLTGGLGGIAHDIAAYLLAAFGIRLLLVGRSPADGAKAARLAELRALGPADAVVYEQVDVADADALEKAIVTAEERWGRPLDGVLHLAAADPTGQWVDLERHTIARESAETYAQQYRAKVTGTLAVARALENRPQAPLVLFGSVNGEFGGHSFGAYSAANSFLTGFTDYWHHERRRPVHCLAWSLWTGVGMNSGQPTAAAENRGFRALDPESGLRLFLDALALPDPYLVIGLDADNPHIVEEFAAQRLRVSEVLVAYVSEGGAGDEVRTVVTACATDYPVPVRIAEVPRIPRDAFGTVDTAQLLRDTAPRRPGRRYSPPETELENRLAHVWAEALGRAQVGRDESFFELGGNSLRATRLLALTDRKLGVRVSTQELYENPTVAGMAVTIGRHRVG